MQTAKNIHMLATNHRNRIRVNSIEPRSYPSPNIDGLLNKLNIPNPRRVHRKKEANVRGEVRSRKHSYNAHENKSESATFGPLKWPFKSRKSKLSQPQGKYDKSRQIQNTKGE